jgi:iron complex outermembrane recepter protein
MEKTRLLLLAGISLAAICQPAAAQDVKPQDSAAENESDIIVTAQKREERRRDVPMSITAATAEQLQSRGVTEREAW